MNRQRQIKPDTAELDANEELKSNQEESGSISSNDDDSSDESDSEETITHPVH